MAYMPELTRGKYSHKVKWRSWILRCSWGRFTCYAVGCQLEHGEFKTHTISYGSQHPGWLETMSTPKARPSAAICHEVRGTSTRRHASRWAASGISPLTPELLLVGFKVLEMEAFKSRKWNSTWVQMVRQVQSHGWTLTALRIHLHEINWSSVFVLPL